MSGDLILDLSRLISRADRTTPTGIDRVELAYARRLLDVAGPRLRFAALNPIGRIAALPRAAAVRYVEKLERVWAGEAAGPGPDLATQGRALLLYALRDGEAALASGRRSRPPTYINVSHHHLDRPASIRRLLKATGGRFVSLVHDLIPIELPEYNRPEQAAKHVLRMRTVAELSDVVIVNSDGTGEALVPHLKAAGRAPPLISAPLGVHLAPADARKLRRDAGRPDFVCISTIEPRKNHLLLFNIWRRLAALGGETPTLHLVGHRGWHNEAALDVIDRSVSVRPHLVEHKALSDADMGELLAGARALLMPSFAEGYGLPVAEALAAGVPVLCSDLPTLRGVGGGAPEYLDPLDGLGWLKAVQDYSRADHPRRQAQLARISAWTPPSWDAHFARVEPHLLEGG